MTRWFAVALVLLLVPLAVPPGALAQTVGGDLFTDASGDVELQSADGSVGQPAPSGADNLDLVGGGVWAETEDAVTFYLKVADLTENSQGAPFMDPDYTLDFRYHGQGYRVFVVTALGNPVNDAFGRDATQAWLMKEVGTDRFQRIADAEAVLEFSEESILVTVPRVAIVDENQAPLSRNATLDGFYATASSLGFFSFPLSTDGSGSGPRVGAPRIYDVAPDDGLGASYVMKTGKVTQRGGLVATSDDPVRWTNGEATTLTFQTRITNTAREELDVRVGTDGTDASWEVAFSDLLTVAPGQSVNATLLVTIPFVHDHGLLKLFDATFESGDDHFASTPLGIYWAEVPQPAGHHDTVWFHSIRQEATPPFDAVFAGVNGWFSAKEDVELDEGIPVPAQFAMAPTPATGNRGIAFWGFYLEPGLRMGLDFLLDEEGLAEFSVALPAPTVDPSLRVQVVHVKETRFEARPGPGGSQTIRETTVLAEGTTEPLAGAVSGTQAFEVPLTPTAEADLVPYEGDGNLYVQVLLDATFLAGAGFANPEAATPSIDPTQSKMRLPLEEYHDPLDLSFQTDGSIRIVADEVGQDRLVNPGRTVVYTFDLEYDGSVPATFHAELTGANLEWATLVGDQHFQLEPGAGRDLAVSVLAPEDARDGDTADLTLRVTNVDNAAVQAGINVRAVVTTSEDIPDEADLQAQLNGELTTGKDSPGAPLALLVAALGALAVALRRRS